jgi:glycosyltransferase involved in cell wall biosynthesis
MASASNGGPSVLFVSNFESNVGYAWRFIEELWLRIAAHPALQGYDALVAFRRITKISELLEATGWPTYQMPFPGSLADELRFIREHRVEVVYLTDRAFCSPRYALYRLAGVKTIIVHDHTPGLRDVPGPVRGLLKRAACAVPGLSCDAAFGVGRFIVYRIIRVSGMPKSRVYRVTNGIDPGEPPSPRPRRDLVRIVTASRADVYKRIDFAIDVVAELVLHRGVTNLHYTFCGDGHDLEAFRQRAIDKGISHVIEFTGRIGNVPERLLEADIALHPSRGEALSLAILEYMRAGLPVVVSDNPSVNSPLEEGVDGLFFREGDVSSGADVLERLIRDPELREEMGRSARRHMVERYSRDNMFAELSTALSAVF